MLFQTTNTLAVSTNWDITAPRQSVRQLQYVVYLHNFMIAQQIVNSYEYKL